MTKADWYDPDLNPKLVEFSVHYNIVPLPCRPMTPRHKGKVERCVGYAQSNSLKGRVFESLGEQNAYLQWWEENVADMRIHGTTRKQVKALFEAERPHLGALPQTIFPCFEEALRKVHPDGHVSVANAYYSAPCEYVGHEVWARSALRKDLQHAGQTARLPSEGRGWKIQHDPGAYSRQEDLRSGERA